MTLVVDANSGLQVISGLVLLHRLESLTIHVYDQFQCPPITLTVSKLSVHLLKASSRLDFLSSMTLPSPHVLSLTTFFRRVQEGEILKINLKGFLSPNTVTIDVNRTRQPKEFWAPWIGLELRN